jgi:transcriptional regulator with XRE-family HTH domain
MSKLMQAIQTKDNETINSMVTNSTTNSGLLDLFFTVAAIRNRPHDEIITQFSHAFDEDSELAIRMLFWARDIRGGQGERKVFRVIARWLTKRYPDIIKQVLHFIPEYGRWDDLFELIGINNSVDKLITQITQKGLINRDTKALLAKWMPREKSAKKVTAIKLAKLLGVSKKEYRKICSGNSLTIETLMSSGKWKDIDFAKIPSIAIKKYRKSLSNHLPNEFVKFLEDVKKGTKKVHAGTLYPYDVIMPAFNTLIDYGSDDNNKIFNMSKLSQTEKNLLNEQWKALPDYFEGDKINILPVIDTSESMFLQYKSNVAPIVISVSLGLYLGERNSGKFKNYFMTFTDNPSVVKITGKTIEDKLNSMAKAEIGYSTNLELLFKNLLVAGIKNKVPESEMPKALLIVSDMEFNGCTSRPSDTAFEMIKRMYEDAGYELPTIVFWRVNVLGSDGNYPVKFDKQNVVLISGASPSNLKYIFSSGQLNPWGIMMNVLEDDRYSLITLK